MVTVTKEADSGAAVNAVVVVAGEEVAGEAEEEANETKDWLETAHYCVGGVSNADLDAWTRHGTWRHMAMFCCAAISEICAFGLNFDTRMPALVSLLNTYATMKNQKKNVSGSSRFGCLTSWTVSRPVTQAFTASYLSFGIDT